MFNHNENIFENLHNIITDIILICNTNFSILDSNRAADIILGKGEHLTGLKCFKVIKNRTLPCHDCPLQATLDSGKILPYSYYDKNLNEYFEERLFPVQKQDGIPDKFVLTCRNISESKNIENKSLQIKKLSALGKISSGVAHDFNNILTILNGRINIIEKQNYTGDIKKHLDMMKKAIFDGADKIRAIQDFGRHKNDEKMSRIDIGDLIEEVLKITEPKWKNIPRENGIIIEPILDLQNNLVIRGIKSELRNGFANIIFNAVDAMPVGGLIKIKTLLQNNYVEIVFEDTGIGMTDEVIEKIFDPFYTTKGEKGTGMGMSEVYGLVKRHNGFINIDSNVGSWTKIIFRFPAVIQKVNKVKSTIENSYNGISLMSVSSNDIQQELIQNICSNYELSLYMENDYDSAMDTFLKHRPTILITDLNEPSMSGFKLAQKVKMRKNNTITILISEVIISPDDMYIYTRTFDHVINPPFRKDKIKINISQILNSIKENAHD